MANKALFWTRRTLKHKSLRPTSMYHCSAKFKTTEVNGNDQYINTGEHTKVCKANNSITPKNEDSMGKNHTAKIENISSQLKKSITDLAVEKIWLQPLNTWELVRDDMVKKFPHGVVIPSSEQFVFLLWNNVF